jgi:transcriptional regulator with XRE-family HTH domain
VSYGVRHFLLVASQASNLRALRLDKRLTQEQVAAKLNVSRSYYSGIECGVRPRDIPQALRTISRMRTRTDRTEGGTVKVGRELLH